MVLYLLQRKQIAATLKFIFEMHPWQLIFAALSAWLLYCVVAAATSPTRHIPGPFLARFTRLWYFYSVYTGHHEKHAFALHRKYATNQYYAPIVRLAPNLYSIVEPDKKVYGASSKMKKSAWYAGWQDPSPNRWTLFTDRDIRRHAETRRKFQGIYSLTSVLGYESYVDDCIALFIARMKDATKSGRPLNMARWLRCYAYDVISNITYGRRLGFLDEGHDVHGILKALDASVGFSTLSGIYPELHPYLYPLMQKMQGSGAAGRQHLMGFINSSKTSREAQRKAQDKEGAIGEGEKDMQKDVLDRMLDLKDDKEKGVTDYHLAVMGIANIVAGADTAAFSLSCILYSLTRNPAAMQKLRTEIAEQIRAGNCDEHHIPFQVTQNMPYMQACIKESLRVESPTRLPLSRTVNEGGLKIGEIVLPAGTDVGVNGWVTHYDRDVWGADVDEFRPERWIEAEEAGGEQLRSMEHHYVSVSNLYLLGSSKILCTDYQRVVGIRIANMYWPTYRES